MTGQTMTINSSNLAHTHMARRILVVDDNTDAADSLVMLLKFSGHTAAAAHSAEAGLALAQTFQPDLVILDIGLPVIDGYEVARRIRSLPALRNLRLFALTAYGSKHHKRRAADVGFDAYLVKPVDLDALLVEVADQNATLTW